MCLSIKILLFLVSTAKCLNDRFSFLVFRAGDITELKILEIPGPGDSRQCGDLQQTDTGIPGVGCQVGPSQNGTGKMLKKPFSSSAPQNIPRRTDMKNQDIIISPQQQCSKSYMDRHMETLSQSKGFRRRHNSCEYVCSPVTFLPAWVTAAIHVLVQQEYFKQKFCLLAFMLVLPPEGLGKRKVNSEERVQKVCFKVLQVWIFQRSCTCLEFLRGGGVISSRTW